MKLKRLILILSVTHTHIHQYNIKVSKLKNYILFKKIYESILKLNIYDLIISH